MKEDSPFYWIVRYEIIPSIPSAIGGWAIVSLWSNPPGIEWCLVTFLTIANIALPKGPFSPPFFRKLNYIVVFGLITTAAMFILL